MYIQCTYVRIHVYTHTYTHTLAIVRFVQQQVTLRSLSATSLSIELEPGGGSRTNLGSLESLHFSNSQLQSALSLEAMELLHFVASRDVHRPPWPFAGERFVASIRICMHAVFNEHNTVTYITVINFKI